MNMRNHVPMAATATSQVKTSSHPSTPPPPPPPLDDYTYIALLYLYEFHQATPEGSNIYPHLTSQPQSHLKQSSESLPTSAMPRSRLASSFCISFVKALSLNSVENRPVKTGGVVTRAMAGESAVVAVPGLSIYLRGKRSFIVGVVDDNGYGWEIVNAPLQKELTADEFRNDASFLVSPLASAITGFVVYVDNGLNTMGLAIDSSAIRS